MRIIESEWETFKYAVGLADAPPQQLTEMRRAFYAGATMLFSQIMAGLEAGKEPTEGDLTRMSAIQNEMAEFNNRVKRGEA